MMMMMRLMRLRRLILGGTVGRATSSYITVELGWRKLALWFHFNTISGRFINKVVRLSAMLFAFKAALSLVLLCMLMCSCFGFSVIGYNECYRSQSHHHVRSCAQPVINLHNVHYNVARQFSGESLAARVLAVCLITDKHIISAHIMYIILYTISVPIVCLPH